MTKHLKTQRRSNLHTFFLCFWIWKNICSPSVVLPMPQKIVQFCKGIEKICGVWCKGAQCSMIKLKQIGILILKLFTVASLLLNPETRWSRNLLPCIRIFFALKVETWVGRKSLTCLLVRIRFGDPKKQILESSPLWSYL
jgi:hypothetical protein